MREKNCESSIYLKDVLTYAWPCTADKCAAVVSTLSVPRDTAVVCHVYLWQMPFFLTFDI